MTIETMTIHEQTLLKGCFPLAKDIHFSITLKGISFSIVLVCQNYVENNTKSFSFF